MNNLTYTEMEDCSIKQEQNDRKILFAILRREVREGRLRVVREEDRVQQLESNERRERR